MAYQINFSGLGQPGNLSDPNNWVGGIVPGSNNLAFFISANVGAPVSGSHSYNSVMLLGPYQTTFTGTLTTTGVPQLCQGLMVCDGAEAIFAPGATLNDPGVLVIGIDAVGALVAEGSGTTHSVINSVDAKLGGMDAGVGTVTINDAIWNNSKGANIGASGQGTLNVLNGGAVHFAADLQMAMDHNAAGTINISSGSEVDVAGTVRVGFSDATAVATVNVNSTGTFTAGNSLVVIAGSKVALAGGTVNAGVSSGNIAIGAGGVISGYGTINTPDGKAVQSSGTILATGGTLNLNDSVNGPGSIQVAANSAAIITGNTSVGSMSVASNSSLTVDGSLLVGGTSTATLAGGTINGGATSSAIAIGTGGVVSGYGTVNSPDGKAIMDNGTILATGGTLDVTGSVGGSGSIQIAANSTAVLTGGMLKLASIAFIGSNATLALAPGSTVTSAISGFGLGDILSVANVSAASFNATTDMLKLTENGTVVENLHFVGNFAGDTFSIHQSAGSAIIALQHS